MSRIVEGKAFLLDRALTNLLANALGRVFSLRRPDSGRKNSGLGSPFVREITHLHGGEAHPSIARKHQRHSHDP